MSDHILIVNEIKSDREELSRALDAEGFSVVESDSASAAFRKIWEGSFMVAFIANVLSDTNANELAKQLRQLAPEIETIIHSRNEARSRLVRRATDIRDGVAA